MTKIDFLYNVDHFTNGLRLILSNFYDNQKTLIYAHDGHKISLIRYGNLRAFTLIMLESMLMRKTQMQTF